jgi:hypothetical protein
LNFGSVNDFQPPFLQSDFFVGPRAGVCTAPSSPLTVGFTLLHPRKNVASDVTTSKRGEPPCHWLTLASVNAAQVNVWPVSR